MDERRFFLQMVRLQGFFLMVFIMNFAEGQPVLIPWPNVKDSSNLVDTHSKPVQFQIEGIFNLKEMGVGLRNDFPGARVNGVKEENDSTIVVTIEPENYPINMSPWYAFKIWSEKPDTIFVKLKYKHGNHRYPPKLSHDGKSWKRIDARDLFSNPGDSTATFRIAISMDTLWVAAQELMCVKYIREWEGLLLRKPFVKSYHIGYSTLGEPLNALTIAEGNDKNLLVVLSRQHPPEITGFMEMLYFVETLAGDKRMARRFRKKFEVIVMPMMNPDGVENGHWRHNAGGVDLNRDWRFFYQPETFALRKFVLQEIADRHLKIRYGVDFHSTQTDLFYVPGPETLPSGQGITARWAGAINKKFPDHAFTQEPSATEGQFSKNWFLYELKTEAITYEVGDNTDREIIKRRGTISALKLMRILLKEYK
jgi:hypothetical protein